MSNIRIPLVPYWASIVTYYYDNKIGRTSHGKDKHTLSIWDWLEKEYGCVITGRKIEYLTFTNSEDLTAFKLKFAARQSDIARIYYDFKAI